MPGRFETQARQENMFTAERKVQMVFPAVHLHGGSGGGALEGESCVCGRASEV